MTLARPTIRFRMASPGDGASTAQADLAEELQRRLRLLQIYSLAALGYFLMSGQSPFGERGAVQMLVAHMHDVPVPLYEVRPEVSSTLSAVIARALAKSPGDRYPTADAFADALGQHQAFGEQLSREQAALPA